MDRSMIISVCSGVLTLIAAIVSAKGPKKYKTIYINILFLTIGSTLGLTSMYIINQSVDPIATEVFGPTPIQVGKVVHTVDDISIEYDGMIQGDDYLTVTSGKKSTHVDFAIRGQESKFSLNNKTYILKLVLQNTINEGEIVIQMYKI